MDQLDSIIDVESLWKAYGSLQVLKGLTLKIHRGETLVILGRSGVGKSVLLRLILGLEKPEKGTVTINGNDVWGLSNKSRRNQLKDMGMLFQGAALFDSMNVLENTAFYLRHHGKPGSGTSYSEEEIRDKVGHALEMVDLAGTEEKMPSDLSGGMKKRAALARLIVYRPKILLYDEPTTGLDPITAMQINQLIVGIQQELKATSIVVTHDIRSALEVGDRLALHDDGKIAQIGIKKDFFDIDDPRVHAFLKNAKL